MKTDYKFDVFISYSRKDVSVADRICAALEKQHISFFIDRKGIGGGMEFPSVLAEAIQNSKIMLFLASNNSYNSKFTKKEVTFAFNEKPSGSLLPYIIDGSKLPTFLRFTFSDINLRTIEEHPIETTLMRDLCQLLGYTYKSEDFLERERKKVEDSYRHKIEESVPNNLSGMVTSDSNNNDSDDTKQEKCSNSNRDNWYVVAFILPLLALGLGIWYGIKYSSFWTGAEIFLIPGWSTFWLCSGLGDNNTKGKYFGIGLALLGVSIGIGIHSGLFFDSILIGVIVGFILSLLSLYITNKGL